MKVLERRMCEKFNYDSVRMIPYLHKFGKANICKLAHKESLLLAKTREWSQSFDDSDSNRIDSPVPDPNEKECQSKRIVTRKKTAVDVSSMTNPKNNREPFNDKLKNGLHRKAFASGCEKRNNLLKDRRKSNSVESSSNFPPLSKVQSPRKRLHKSNTDSDDNAPSLGKAAKKKSRLAKSHSWLSWRTSQASASPSSYTVKTDETLTLDSDNDSTHKSRINTRRSRSISVASETRETEKPAKRDEPTMSRSEKTLIVKWDSDKNDEPDILEKSTVGSRKLSLTSGPIPDKVVRSGTD